MQLGYNDLSSWNFAGQNLSRSVFESAVLKNASFAGADLSRVRFSDADLTGADFKGARFAEITPHYTFTNSKLNGADLSGVDLAGVSFSSVDLTDAKFNDALIANTTFAIALPTFSQLTSTISFRLKDLRGIGLRDGFNFSNVDLRGFNFSNAVLDQADFTGADLTGAQIQGVSFLNSSLTPEQFYSTQSYQMKNLRGMSLSQDLTNFNFQGQDLSNSIISSVSLNGTDFTDAMISGMTLITSFSKEQLYSTQSYKSKDLRGVRFHSQVDLKNVDLSGQNLTGAFIPEGMSNANLTNAVITDATLFEKLSSNQISSTKSYQEKDLRGVYFSAQDLQALDFSNQDLRHAKFDGSQLGQANFAQANVTGASFARTNFTKEQLYVTKSYQDGDLHGMALPSMNEAWNLAGQDLRLAQLANVSGSDLRGANLSSAYLLSFDLNSAQVNSDTIYNQWTTFVGEFDPVAAGMTRIETAQGDFNANTTLDVEDLLAFETWLPNAQSRDNGRTSPAPWLPRAAYDLNGDEVVDDQDLAMWVHDLKKTTFGDTNLDGTFDSGDLVEVFAAGEYEDTYTGNSHWETGDWNLDGDFDSGDLLLAFQDGGFEAVAAARPGRPSASQLSVVPEPGTLSWWAMTGFVFFVRQARNRSHRRQTMEARR